MLYIRESYGNIKVRKRGYELALGKKDCQMNSWELARTIKKIYPKKEVLIRSYLNNEVITDINKISVLLEKEIGKNPKGEDYWFVSSNKKEEIVLAVWHYSN